jgi:DNA-3-methyladenine glycosylase
VVLTEVEAYGGPDDPASHAFRGETPRNRSMFGDPGTLYVYRSYGVHWCMNVVCGPPGIASAVLLRGGIPVEGLEVIEERRKGRRPLTVGPGNLTQALGVTGEHDGWSLAGGRLRLEEGRATGAIATSPRIGISRAADRPWRFVLSLFAHPLTPD